MSAGLPGLPVRYLDEGFRGVAHAGRAVGLVVQEMRCPVRGEFAADEVAEVLVGGRLVGLQDVVGEGEQDAAGLVTAGRRWCAAGS
jgi:hypothetical protein